MAENVSPSSTGYLPIEDQGVIGDLHTVALVGVNGDIDLCCLPRFDSPSVFGALLDTQRAGRFTLTSSDAVRTKQMYHPDTNVLLTRFLGADSVAEVVDFMVPRDGTGGSDGGHLVRRLRAARGRVTGRLRCAPWFDYGRAPHDVRFVEAVGAVFSSPAGRLVLRSTTPLRVDGNAVVAQPVLAEGESIELVLSWDGDVVPLRPGQVADWLAATESGAVPGSAPVDTLAAATRGPTRLSVSCSTVTWRWLLLVVIAVYLLAGYGGYLVDKQARA
jgi:GH15 family glucan-1,4-alpha-glucosidase